MAEVVIRLKRLGTKSKPHHRIVVIPKTRARGGRALEELGYYDPSKNPPFIQLNMERTSFWLGKGARPTATVDRLIKKLSRSKASA